MLPLTICDSWKNKKAPEDPGPFCRPGNAQSFVPKVPTEPADGKQIRIRGAR